MMDSDVFQVLSLQGGGVRGLFTASYLAHLEEDLDVKVQDHFDLIVGTSTGGIIALALGLGMRPAEIAERYQELAVAVFPKRRRRPWALPRRLIRPTYDPATLRAKLHDILGDAVLGDSDVPLVVPSFDLEAGDVHLFKTPHHPRLRRDYSVPMVDVGLATSAAPTFFPVHARGGHRWIDGGVWANDPAVVGIAEAVSMFDQPLANIRVANFGTVAELREYPSRLDRGGLASWARSGVTVFMTANAQANRGLAQHLLGPDGVTAFNVEVPGGTFSLDEANLMKLTGKASAGARAMSPAFHRFAAHLATKYTPYHGR